MDSECNVVCSTNLQKYSNMRLLTYGYLSIKLLEYLSQENLQRSMLSMLTQSIFNKVTALFRLARYYKFYI